MAEKLLNIEEKLKKQSEEAGVSFFEIYSLLKNKVLILLAKIVKNIEETFQLRIKTKNKFNSYPIKNPEFSFRIYLN